MPTQKTTKKTTLKKTPAKSAGRVTSGKAAASKKVSSAADWKKAANRGVTLEVPSGQVCRAKRPGLKEFVKKGMIPNNLMPIVNQAMNEGKAPKDIQGVQEALKDVDVEEVMDLVDRITCYVVMEPEILPIVDENGEEIADDERDEDEIYVDDVDFEDKMFIFNWAVGGSSDVEQFRKQQAEMLGSVSPG